MSERLLIAVCGYAGDADRVKSFMPLYRHHQCPVLVLSPEDSPITSEMIGGFGNVICRSEGKRAYIGDLSGERQAKHLRMMLDGGYSHVLANDSDSFCLAPELPRYLFEEPDVVWSNEVSDEMHIRPEYVLPRIAMQPPYFFSRQALERLVAATATVKMNQQTPYIDHYMLQLTHAAGLRHKAFPESGLPSRIFLHPVKTLFQAMVLKANYANYLATNL